MKHKPVISASRASMSHKLRQSSFYGRRRTKDEANKKTLTYATLYACLIIQLLIFYDFLQKNLVSGNNFHKISSIRKSGTEAEIRRNGSLEYFLAKRVNDNDFAF